MNKKQKIKDDLTRVWLLIPCAIIVVAFLWVLLKLLEAVI